MAESILSDLAVKLLENMGKAAGKELASYFGKKGKLNKLENTMRMIQARLHDAEKRGEGGDHEAAVREWLNRLKRVLYSLEDLFEEVAMAEQKQGGKLTTRSLSILFFSSSNPLKINKMVSSEAKSIMEEMEAIRIDMLTLNFREQESIESGRVSLPTVNLGNKRERETHSFVREEEVIGRERDKYAILKLLGALDHYDVESSSSSSSSMSVIPIFGIGGLGKTTLAQLVFNDETVEKHFEVKWWVCISEISSFEELVGKVLKSITVDDYSRCTLDRVQSCLREAVKDKKYLLVLDDLWDEDRERWLRLKDLLLGGQQGSKIIVTTRSRVVAENMGTVPPYALKGLGEDKSWKLFTNLAFKEGQEKNPIFTSIGKEIVKSCANVPLAIRTIAGLLYTKDTVEEWEYVKNDAKLITTKQEEDGIMSTLKLSYDHLPSSKLKKCFAYCSLFPKDHYFYKEDVIHLWMAQGFLRPLDGSRQSPEDIGHLYFMELLRRSFFEDDRVDNSSGDKITYKMHDLMNDLAKRMAIEECVLVDEAVQKIDKYTWHVSCTGNSMWEVDGEAVSTLLAMKHLRSLLFIDSISYHTRIIKGIFSSLRHLRALLLPYLHVSLPDSIGELIHLRYLKVRGDFEFLPESVLNLQYLQTFDVSDCKHLRQLPEGFNKLRSLRHLIIHPGRRVTHDVIGYMWEESSLDCMPPKLWELPYLRRLSTFVVGENNELDELANFDNLMGELAICFKKQSRKATREVLKGTKLTNLLLSFPKLHDANLEDDELELECLQPPPTLETLHVWNWYGPSLPSWGTDELPCLLPNLVSITISNCKNCRKLPPFSGLPRLRHLSLLGLQSLEYIDIGGLNIDDGTSERRAYFSSLEHLELKWLDELKGMWPRVEYDQHLPTWPSFPSLLRLHIEDCSKLMSVPPVRIVSIVATVDGYALDDGYAWRKYGQKELFNAKYPRSYYRCIHKYDQGCLAIKRVQRLCENPNKFRIYYTGIHTCKYKGDVIRLYS